jgi:hypothetical protein
MHEMALDVATLALAVGLTACGRGPDRAAAGAAAEPMPPSGTPMAHMDLTRAMADTGRAMRGDLCAVGPASAAERRSDGRAGQRAPRVVLIVDAEAAGRPTRVAVTLASTERAGLSAEWVVDGRTRVACAGDDLMISGAGAAGASARLGLASGGPVTVVARTADARVLAGPVRVGPGARAAVLAWGDAASERRAEQR